jgi:DNA-binding phage protein
MRCRLNVFLADDKPPLLGGGTKQRQRQDIGRPRPDGAITSGADERNNAMALTRSFKETVRARVERDPAFRAALLTEAVEQMLAGDMETGKAVLRDYINATVGFERFARETGTPSKSLMRMFGPKGNPRASNLFAVISQLQKVCGIRLGVAADR